MIQEQVSKILSKLTTRRRNQSDSVNGVILKTLEKSKYNQPDDIDSWTIPMINPIYAKSNKDRPKEGNDKVVTEGYKETPITNDKNGPVRVSIPAGPGSIYASALINVPKDSVAVGFNDEKKTMRFKIFGSGKFGKTTAETTGGGGETTGDITKTKDPWFGSPKIALYLIANPDEFEKISNLVNLALKILNKMDEKDIKEFNSTCKSTINSIYSKADKINSATLEVPMVNITNFQKNLNKQVIAMDKFADISTDVSMLDKATIKSMNLLTHKLTRIQISLNMLSSAIEDKNIINANFIGCIKSCAMLDIFVKSCIDAGIPPKYIAYNTWLVADKCIRGEGTEYKPVWGQTRCVLFPPGGRVVYKVATSGAGITSNEAEIRTSKLFVDAGRVDLIAPIVRTWKHSAVVAMECIKSNGSMPYKDILAYTKEFNSVIKEIEKKTGQKINTKISDQHKDNVKFDLKNSVARSIDYGITKRSYK